MLLHPRVAPLDKGADRGRRGVEDIDAVFRDNRPEAVFLRKVGRTLIHEDGRACRQRPVDGVAVTRDPADIGGAPENILVLEVEYPLHRHQGMREIAAGRMNDTLRFAGGAGGVEGEKGMLGVERLGGTIRALPRDDFIPPDVAPMAHLDLLAGAVQDQAFPDRRRALERLVNMALELNALSAPPATVGGDN